MSWNPDNYEEDQTRDRDILLSMTEIQRHAGLAISRILENATGQPYWDALRLGHSLWQCKDSPVLICIYDSHLDPAMDQCLFCSQPDERK